jgi:hypothetical protein
VVPDEKLFFRRQATGDRRQEAGDRSSGVQEFRMRLIFLSANDLEGKADLSTVPDLFSRHRQEKAKNGTGQIPSLSL